MPRPHHALVGAFALAWGAVLLLRPDEGLIEPDPVDVQDYFSTDDIVRSRRFGYPQLALQFAGAALQGAALLLCVRRCRQPKAARASAPTLQAAVGGAGLTLALNLAPLPMRALARRRALAVGLATQSWRGWALDVAKGLAIDSALNGGVAVAAVTLMRRYPRCWWLLGALGSTAGAVVFTFLAPVVLDPIFNRFTVLPDGPVRGDILELSQRSGVRVGEVYRVDASRRTTAANAYVTGLGATKRVVLFDTLLESFTREETRLVVAHELGHVRHRDVARHLAHVALSAPGAMYASSVLLAALGHDPARVPVSARVLPALALSVGVASAVTGSTFGALSRRVESRADAFSLRLTGEAQPFIAFEQRIVKQNLADPDPPRWLVRVFASHPPAVERIGIARAYARGQRRS
ncbi:MAG TPA: M48 family metallopeptidase [Solirubrobacteraceae bacterium]|jgi:STE24 endopeptidase